MDQQYSNNVSGTPSYQHLPSIAPQQLQHNAPQPPHTLPPLQQQVQHPSAMMQQQNMYGQNMSAPHTPTTTTPNTPGSVGSVGHGGGFPQMNAQSASRGYLPGGNSYQQQPMNSYNTSSSMMVAASTAMSHPQTLAPTPVSSNGRNGIIGLVPIRPNTSQAPMHAQHAMHSHLHSGMNSPYGHHPIDPSQPPTHVVGSQGRRGILPSAPGKPPVGPATAKNTPVPQKDADGKYPCPHCTKTYLHAKHLKRHMLRHTGDRPYMCVLCKDTFSRSDILKRHFQKCSIRRGNPGNVTHLEYAQSHLKGKGHKGSNSGSADGDMVRNMNSAQHGLPMDHSNGIYGMPGSDNRMNEGHLNIGEDDAHSNGLKRLSNGGAPRDRRSLTGPITNGSARASFEQNFSGDIPTSMSGNLNNPLAFAISNNGHNGVAYGQNYDFNAQTNGNYVKSEDGNTNGSRTGPMYSGDQGWAGGVGGQMYPTGAQDGYVTSFNPSLVQTQAIKAEPSITNPTDNLFTGMYNITNSDSTIEAYPDLAMLLYQQDPVTVEQVALQTVDFCCPPGVPGPHIPQIRSILSFDNFKHFMELFTNFQGHFPIIHMPTFRISTTYQGLLLAMVCIGSVYSDRVSPTQVRELMEQARMIIERDSHVFQAINRDSSEDPSFGYEMYGRTNRDLEEIQAIFLLHSIFTWHGTPVQREMARRKFPKLAKLARIAGLTRPSTSSQSYSVLHQTTAAMDGVNAANFDWDAWVQQEKRARIFFTIFLCDAAMCMYFGGRPNFDGRDIALPLPTDDAAWEAGSANQCAAALGLRGAAVGDRQILGTGLPKQPELQAALADLLNPGINLLPGTTNIMSKFILVHSLIVLIWRAHREPLPNADGIGPYGQQTSALNQLNTISDALDKWKVLWDQDMMRQYPPGASLRRFGFCRDGIHFYYLGKYLLKLNLDPNMAPDQRFSRVMEMLRRVKQWPYSESAQRGEELGSVGEIDKDYGVSNLTLNMAHLFKPINQQIDSPIPGVHTNIHSGLI